MIRGDLNYDTMQRWMRLFEFDLSKIILEAPCRGHEEACRFLIDTFKEKLREYDEENNEKLTEQYYDRGIMN